MIAGAGSISEGLSLSSLAMAILMGRSNTFCSADKEWAGYREWGWSQFQVLSFILDMFTTDFYFERKYIILVGLKKSNRYKRACQELLTPLVCLLP